MRRLPALALVLLVASTALPGLAAAPDAEAQLIVAFDHEVGTADGARLAALGAEVVRVVPNADFVVVRAERALEFSEAARRMGDVRYVEPDQPLVSEGTPNDIYWNRQWGPQAINADDAWDVVAGGDGVAYAVIDTGVDYLHPDITPNIWLNQDENPLDGVDNDGNGYVDDLVGWDCENNDNDPLPDASHGTHVAGIAAARANNVAGIAGVAGVKIMAMRTFTSGLAAAWAAECIRYAADNGARVIGMSWFTSPSTVITEAIQYAWSRNALLVKSAGNQGNGGPVTYPGTLPEVIAVSALASPTSLASYSSTGAKVELAAPGSNILSSVPLYSGNINGIQTPGYASYSGTSMAQPHVAGVACLVLAKNPALTNQQVRDLLAATADDLGATGRDAQFGHGRVNALRAVQAA